MQRIQTVKHQYRRTTGRPTTPSGLTRVSLLLFLSTAFLLSVFQVPGVMSSTPALAGTTAIDATALCHGENSHTILDSAQSDAHADTYRHPCCGSDSGCSINLCHLGGLAIANIQLPVVPVVAARGFSTEKSAPGRPANDLYRPPITF